jgi:hypothetical protein
MRAADSRQVLYYGDHPHANYGAIADGPAGFWHTLE